MSAAVALAGANVHDSRPVTPTAEGRLAAAPEPSAERPKHLCLDKAYDMRRVEEEARRLGYTPRASAGSEKKSGPQPLTPKPTPPGVGWSSAPSPGSGASAPSAPATLAGGENYLALLHLACALVLSRRVEAIA